MSGHRIREASQVLGNQLSVICWTGHSYVNFHVVDRPIMEISKLLPRPTGVAIRTLPLSLLKNREVTVNSDIT